MKEPTVAADWIIWAGKRIADLEAEVERLRAERDFWRKGIEMHPWTKPGDMEEHQAAFEAMYRSVARKERDDG